MSKITERAVFDQVYAHVINNKLFPELHRLTGNALRRRWLLDIFSSYFTILLRRLKTSFGVTGDALKWVASYLSARSQRVMIDGVLSYRFDMSFGVPQGSCPGPPLFSAYASKLFQVMKNHLPNAHAYADDSQLYLSFKPDTSMGETEARGAMDRCIRAVRAWLIIDKLKLNEDKSEFMLIGTRQQLSKVRTDSLMVGDTQVKSVSEARNLGVWFGSNFQFRSHINKACQSAFFSLHNILRIRKYLPFEAAKSLVQAFVISRIDYCNAVLYGLPAILVHRLQRVQNAAARLLTNTPRYSHITPVMVILYHSKAILIII